MKCSTCPVGAGTCLGESASRLCSLARAHEGYRRHLADAAEGLAIAERSGIRTPDDALAAVAACPDRGQVLPLSLQPECGCSELSECRRGRGSVAGRVALHDCLSCVIRARSREAPSGHGGA